MADTKTTATIFAVGAGLIAAGLASVPFGEIFIPVGTGLASFSYGLVANTWRQGPTARKISAPKASAPTPTAPEASSPPVTAPPAPTSPKGTPPEPPREKGKLPSIKKPSITLPKIITAHRGPIALIVIGLPLTVVGLILAGITPSVALGYGIFIPGVLLFGVGGLILFLQLYRRPAGVRRFCMHCGFPMMTNDFECSRCHRQPPSGIDTKACPNCNAVIPALAKFCKDCGAGQPTS
jgi:hypothetical protein